MNEFDIVKKRCIELFEDNTYYTPLEMAEDIMRDERMPLFHAYHHYLTSAVLITKASIIMDRSKGELLNMLESARSRAAIVPAGFSCTHGTCGAAIGCGIFGSLWTEATYETKVELGLISKMTAACLRALSVYDCPMCCKRAAFVSIIETCKIVEKDLGIKLMDIGRYKCSFADRNDECCKQKCAFYPKK